MKRAIVSLAPGCCSLLFPSAEQPVIRFAASLRRINLLLGKLAKTGGVTAEILRAEQRQVRGRLAGGAVTYQPRA